MLENTWYSVISPESCSSILWRNWDNKERAAEALRLTAGDMNSLKLIDGIVPEPIGGAHSHPNEMFQTVKKLISDQLDELCKISSQERVNRRIDKFCSMGVYKQD